MISTLALVAVIGIVVAVIINRRVDGPVTTEGSLRRVFVYSLVLLGTVLTASGLAGLVRAILQELSGTTVVTSGRGLALGLALTTVGGPLWLLSGRVARRAATASEDERRSTGRRLALALLRLLALGIGVPYLIDVGHWIVGAASYDAVALARALVWLGIWGLHERVARDVPFGSAGTGWPDRLEVYLATAAGFGVAAVSAGLLLGRSLESVYVGAVGTSTLVEGGSTLELLREPAVAAVVGGAVWAWHWLRVAEPDAGSRAWYVVVFLVGVLAGTLTALIGASVMVHAVLAWLVGAAQEGASQHFQVVPGALAALLVGLATWRFHRARYRERERPDEGEPWTGPERVHRYLVAGVTMLATAGGLATLLAVTVDALVPGRVVVEAGGLRSALALGATLVLVGAPVWWRFWSGIQARAARFPDERASLARKILIFGVFGAAIVTTVSAASVLLFAVFEALLEDELTTRLLEDERWSVALLLTAGTVSLFHGLVLREDRAHTTETGPTPALREVVLVAPMADELAARMRPRGGVKLTVWPRREPDVEPEEAAPDGHVAEDLDARLDDVRARKVLVVVDPDHTVELIPLADR